MKQDKKQRIMQAAEELLNAVGRGCMYDMCQCMSRYSQYAWSVVRNFTKSWPGAVGDTITTTLYCTGCEEDVETWACLNHLYEPCDPGRAETKQYRPLSELVIVALGEPTGVCMAYMTGLFERPEYRTHVWNVVSQGMLNNHNRYVRRELLRLYAKDYFALNLETKETTGEDMLAPEVLKDLMNILGLF